MKLFYIILFFCFIFDQALAGGDDVKLFSLYPVPLKTSVLNVQINFRDAGVASVELRNLIGKKIQEKQLPSGVNLVSFENMDMNPNGIYIVLAKNANGKVLEISKFILNK